MSRTMLSVRLLALVAALSFSPASIAQTDAPRVLLPTAPMDLNSIILSITRSMPVGGSYAVTAAANRVLQSAITIAPGGFSIEPQRAQPSYCSGATYLVLAQAFQHLQKQRSLQLEDATLRALLVSGQSDGQGVWGRWNANGPGTARLFHELGLGRNFLDYEKARPGDFMKIFWTNEIGKRERGHSVIYLGSETQEGVELVRFWSSNQPGGYGEKAVPKTKVALALFSRLEKPAVISRVVTLPPRDSYLASMLNTGSSLAELKTKCGM